jgi:hypothetical protein
MIRRNPRARAGITLTEILISILIMGVGLVSLATLFPIGLLRLRNAQRLSRSAFLVESAAADLGSRDLFNKASFLNLSPWYFTPYPFVAGTSVQYDPWIQDTPSYGAASWLTGVYRGNGGNGIRPNTQTPGNPYLPGPGLPVAYDPLWRLQTNSPAGYYLDSTNFAAEARFASGIGFIRTDPDTNPPSSYGLQRLTNFANVPANLAALAQVPSIFVSPEDIVFQSSSGASAALGLSPIVPDMTITGSVTNDWRYSWMFTGQQADAANGTIFTGDIVIFENRPFSIDAGTNVPYAAQLALPTTTPQFVAGEPVFEAVFGYTGNPSQQDFAGYHYGPFNSRVVLLRWPATVPDPDVRVGGWIADVTYERLGATDAARWNGIFSGQRCYWYQVIKKSTAAADTLGDVTNYRSMTVWVSTPLKALTPLNTTTTPVTPLHVNAALVSPYVVNVFPKTFYSR